MDKNYFFKNSNIDVFQAAQLLEDALVGFDDGELYIQYGESENISIIDRVIKSSSFDINQGFGMRGVVGEVSGFAHSNILDKTNIEQAIEVIKSVAKHDVSVNIPLIIANNNHHKLYPSLNPISEHSFNEKINLLTCIDEYLRTKNSLVKKVSASISTSCKKIQIIRNKDFIISDTRRWFNLESW